MTTLTVPTVLTILTFVFGYTKVGAIVDHSEVHTYTLYISCLQGQATKLTLFLFDCNSMKFPDNRGRWCCIRYFEF